jgi:UDPglucose 6-dehydrogenase
MTTAVIGAGYVGLTTAGCLAHIGHDVVCGDSDLDKLHQLKNGVMPLSRTAGPHQNCGEVRL